jgi:hypothetical protein
MMPAMPTMMVKTATSNAAILMSFLPQQTDDFVDTPCVVRDPRFHGVQVRPILARSPRNGVAAGY